MLNTWRGSNNVLVNTIKPSIKNWCLTQRSLCQHYGGFRHSNIVTGDILIPNNPPVPMWCSVACPYDEQMSMWCLDTVWILETASLSMALAWRMRTPSSAWMCSTYSLVPWIFCTPPPLQGFSSVHPLNNQNFANNLHYVLGCPSIQNHSRNQIPEWTKKFNFHLMHTLIY